MLLLTVMVVLLLVVLGVCLGSFVNAFVWRHYQIALVNQEQDTLKTKKKPNEKSLANLESKKRDLSISTGRSMCPHCRHALSSKDLIPVISFVWLRGKCRYCGERIEDTPLAELLTPLLFVCSYVLWPQTLQGLEWILFGLWLIFLVGFVVLVLYDLRWQLLPHNIVLPLIGLAVLYVLLDAFIVDGGVSRLMSGIWGALIIGGLFYALFVLSKEQWIGGGDITLGVLLGLLVGGPANAFLLIFLASLLGSIIAVPLLLLGKATRSTPLPFGPFLILAGIITMLFGDRILDWYATSFLII